MGQVTRSETTMPATITDPDLNKLAKRLRRASQLERMLPQLTSLLEFTRQAEQKALEKAANNKWFEHGQIHKGRAAVAGAVRKKLERILRDKR